MKRYEFNELIRKAYAKSGLLVDIARVESTLPDGRRSTYTVNNRTYYHLYSGYSDDRGHLNTVGKLWAAESLLNILDNIVQE